MHTHTKPLFCFTTIVAYDIQGKGEGGVAEVLGGHMCYRGMLGGGLKGGVKRVRSMNYMLQRKNAWRVLYFSRLCHEG